MTFQSLVVLSLHILYNQVECEEFKPRVDLAWQRTAYDIWVAYDVRIGRLLDRTIAYSIMSIKIDLV